MTVPAGFKAMEARRGSLDAVAENTARYASSYVSFTTTGWGEFQSPDCQRFKTAFVRRPSVTHSFSVDGDSLVEGRFPRVTAGVHKWLQDEQGMFIGAWLFFVVETIGLQARPVYVMPTPADGDVATVKMESPIPADPNYTLIHDFVFTGVAMKSLPTEALAQAIGD